MRDPVLKERPHFGLDELTTLVSEMQKTKAGTNKAEHSSTTATATEDAVQKALSLDEKVSPGDDAEGDASMDCFGDDHVEEVKDPVKEKAIALADADIHH